MFWLGIMLVTGVVALMVVTLRKRPADVHKLGSVSTQWLAEHRSQ